MKKIIGFIIILLMIPFVILVIGDIEKTPIYPTVEFNIEKISRTGSFDIENNDIELFKLPNGVGDKWFSDGTIERNVKKVILNGSEAWQRSSSQGYYRLMIDLDLELKSGIRNDIISNLYTSDSVLSIISNDKDKTYTIYNNDATSLIGAGFNQYILVRDNTYSTLEAFKQYLNSNNLIIYYQTINPTIENATVLPDSVGYFDGGNVFVDDGILDYSVVGNLVQINYIEGNITTFENGNFIISKPTKIISEVPNIDYLEYGTLTEETYNNILEFINDNQNIKLYYDDIIQESEYNIYLENDIIIVNNDTEFIRIYNDDTYTSINNLDTNINYKLEWYDIIDYTEGGFDDAILGLFWFIPVLLAGLLIYLLFKRKE